MNRLDGDAAGPVKVLVSNPLYSHDRQHVIIPEGAVVLGDAKKIGATGFGQQRGWPWFPPPDYARRLLRRSRPVSSLDQIGEQGLKDKVNNHYLQIFGTSIALGVVAGRARSLRVAAPLQRAALKLSPTERRAAFRSPQRHP